MTTKDCVVDFNRSALFVDNQKSYKKDNGDREGKSDVQRFEKRFTYRVYGERSKGFLERL